MAYGFPCQYTSLKVSAYLIFLHRSLDLLKVEYLRWLLINYACGSIYGYVLITETHDYSHRPLLLS